MSLAGGGAISGSVSLVTSATLSFDGGTFIVSNAAFNGAGTTRLGPATWQLTGASSVDSGFVVDGGIVNGTGSLSLTGSTNWIKGTMTGGGTVNVATGASVLMPLTNTGSRVLSRPMTNQGTLTIAKGLTSGLDLGAGITLTNGTTGVIDLQGDDVGIKATSGSGTIVNGGVVERSTGAGTATIGVPLTSSFDDVHVQVGTLSLTGGGTFSGTGQLPQGTALSFDSGAFDIGDTDIHGNGTVNIGVATWHLSGTASVFSTLVINGGTIDGGGDLNLSGVDTWTRGTITGPSALHVGSGSLTLPATTAGDRVLARPLSLAGTLRVGPGLSAGLFVGSGVSITNDVGSLIELQGDRADIKATTGGGRVVNLGSVEHTGSGKATIAVELDNTGEVDVVGGALTATSTFDAYDPAMKAMTKGTYFLAGVLQFPNAGIVTNNAWIRLTGPSADIQDTGGVSALTALAANGPAGTIQLRGGRSLTAKPLTNDGLIDVDVSSTLSIPGDYTQSPTGTLAIGVGTTPGKLAVSKKATLAGTLELTTTNGFGPAIGASFVVSTYASRSGCFTTIAGRDLGGGRYLDVACAATKATATVKRVTISIDDVTATEGDDGTQSFTFTVSVNHARPDLAMSVNWATVGGTAKAPGDFAGGSGTLTWDAGDATPRTIVVKVKGDTLDEGDEAFSVVLSAASNVFITDGTGTGTIIDDDPAAAMVSRPDCTSGSVGTPWT